MRTLLELSPGNLEALLAGLESGGLDPARPEPNLARLVGGHAAHRVGAELRELASEGMIATHVAHVVRAAISERRAHQLDSDRIQLVWTVGATHLAPGRQTSATVRELFRNARHRVLVTTYSIDWIGDERSQHPFYELARNMEERPELAVRVVVNIRRGDDARPPDQVVASFAQRFPSKMWPGSRLPQVFYHSEGPLPFQGHGSKRACQHSKGVVVDGRLALISSANFSDAAHERNLELGVRLEDRRLAESIEEQVDALIRSGVLSPLTLR